MPNITDFRQDPFTFVDEPVQIFGECHTIPSGGKPHIKLNEKPYENVGFPIVIQQTAGSSGSVVATKDATVHEGAIFSNFGNSVVTRVGRQSAGLGSWRWYSFYEFNIAALPMIAAGATLNIRKAAQSGSGVFLVPVDLHWVNSAWNESTINWNNQPGFNAGIQDTTLVGNNPGGGMGPFYSWDLTSLYNQWKIGAIPNFGVVLRSTTGATDTERDFISKETSTPANHPFLNVIGMTTGLTETGSPAPGPSEFVVNYDRGCIGFNAALAGQEVCVTYWGMGTNITAEFLCDLLTP